MKKKDYSDYFPKDHEKIAKEEKGYPYSWITADGLDHDFVPKTIALDFPMRFQEDSKWYQVRILSEAEQVIIYARQRITKQMKGYDTSTPEGHRKLMELEYEYLKPIYDKYKK